MSVFLVGIVFLYVCYKIIMFFGKETDETIETGRARVGNYWTYQDLDESDEEFRERLKKERKGPEKRAIKTGNFYNYQDIDETEEEYEMRVLGRRRD